MQAWLSTRPGLRRLRRSASRRIAAPKAPRKAAQRPAPDTPRKARRLNLPDTQADHVALTFRSSGGGGGSGCHRASCSGCDSDSNPNGRTSGDSETGETGA